MNDLYVETRLQAIKDIASASCVDIKDADNIASFCDEIYSAIPKIDKSLKEGSKNVWFRSENGLFYCETDHKNSGGYLYCGFGSTEKYDEMIKEN